MAALFTFLKTQLQDADNYAEAINDAEKRAEISEILKGMRKVDRNIKIGEEKI